MNQEISMEKYPYEMFCTECNHVSAYLDHKPAEGSPIKSAGAILADGTMPVSGTPIECKCPPETLRGWATRERQEIKSPIQMCGECGSMDNKIVAQCLNCGCAVCEKCTTHEDKCSQS